MQQNERTEVAGARLAYWEAVARLARELASFEACTPLTSESGGTCAACQRPVPPKAGVFAIGQVPPHDGTLGTHLHKPCATDVRDMQDVDATP